MARRRGVTRGSGETGPARRAKPPMSRVAYVQSVLTEEILDGTLPPGTPILQEEIGSRLGVSITPVREALRKLESVGLVSYETHYGAVVASMSDQEIEELYLLRGTVEGLAARLAAQDITPAELRKLRAIHEEMAGKVEQGDRPELAAELAAGSRRFHEAIARAGGRTIIAKHLKQIWESHPIPVGQSTWSDPSVRARALEFHARLLDRLEAGDSTGAEALMVEHVRLAATHRIAGRAAGDPADAEG